MENNLSRRSLLKGALAGAAGLAAAPLIGIDSDATADNRLTARAFVPGLASDGPASTSTPPTQKYLQGWAPGPLGLAITKDGKTAYISFSLDDSLLIVDLPTLTITDSVDLSPAGIQLHSAAALLTPDGKLLYVSNPAAQNVMVIDTIKKRIAKVLPIPPYYSVALTVSLDGTKVYIPSVDGALYIVSTADQSYQRINIPGLLFGPIALSRDDPSLVYTVGTLITNQGATFQSNFIAFNLFTHVVARSVSLPADVVQYPTTPCRLVLNSSETLAYFGWLRQPGDRGIGNLVTFSLDTFQVATSVRADNGVGDFVLQETSGKIYVIGFWAGGGSPNNVPILEWDIATARFVRDITLSPSSDQRAIVLDPTNPDFLYETDGDQNILRRIQLSTSTELSALRFNQATVRPYAILCDGDTGYVVSQASQEIVKLDLRSGELRGRITVASPFGGWGLYQGKLYVSSGRAILAVNLTDGAIIQRYPIGWDIRPLMFTFVGDRMVTIDFDQGMIAKQVVLFDAATMSILKTVPLPSEPHGDKVIASLDGSKLYVGRGPMSGGTAVFTIFNAVTLEAVKAIEIPPAKQRRGHTTFGEGEFDEAKRIVYLTGFESVYKIDMDTDRLVGTLDLIDVFEAWGRRGWTPTALSGISLSPSKDKLFVASGDAHSLYCYDIANSSWTTKMTNLRGYFITDGVTSQDRRYFYTANSRSDSVTMVDLTSGEVVRVIDLHAQEPEP